ncbi:MAG TPA: hypothetical protein VK697_02375 [Methylomirabilota bacterium]|jgi:hypothetical protein|nr:hypothetical protein [Methylomirabilota bacterium]
MENPQSNDDVEPYVLEVLEPDEVLRARARARDAVIAVSDRRLIVAARERVALSIGFDELRRIQFDIERDRPATMVIVPEEAHYEPQVLAIPPQEFKATAEALALIGLQLANIRQRESRASEGTSTDS